MALTLGDNFSYQGAKPLDARLKYDTVAAMKAVADATMYEGCLAYCSGTDKTYQWKSANTVDETLGKWREFNSGGGGGGGETYTAGDGIDISGENVISTEKSQNGWMDEVIEKVPMSGALVNIANAFNRSDLYSTTEKIVGQWIDGKPLYQQVVDLGTISNNVNKEVAVSGSLTMTVVNLYGILIDANGVSFPLPYVHDRTMSYLIAIRFSPSTGISIFSRDNTGINGSHAYAVIRYTKTTDSAIAIGSETEYSTDEKIIGTWIDGKPLYQKTIEYTTQITMSSTRSLTKLADLTSLAVDEVINYRASMLSSSGSTYIIPYISLRSNLSLNSNIFINENNELYLECYRTSDTMIITKVLCTIQYTKLT